MLHLGEMEVERGTAYSKTVIQMGSSVIDKFHYNPDKPECQAKKMKKPKDLTSVYPCYIMIANGVLSMSGLDNHQIMAKNIRRYMDAAGVKPKDVCNALEISMSTFSDWINGKTYPRIDKIERMAAYFGVSKSALVEENTSNAFVEDIVAGFWEGDQALTEEDIRQIWGDVLDYIKFRTEQQRKRNE